MASLARMVELPRFASLYRAVSLALVFPLALAGCKKDAAAPVPTGSEGATVAPSDIPAAQQSVTDWIRSNYKDEAGDGALLYASGDVDLDGDGTNEVLAYVGGPMLCGTGGCNLVVLKRKDGTLNKVSELSVVQLPVGVLDSRTHGWRDLAVTVAGGGIAATTVRVPFDGGTYMANPTVAPAEESDAMATEVIPDQPLKPVP